MTRKLLLTVYLTSLSCMAIFAQTGEETLRRMHNTYRDKWYKTFTFIQQTEFYRNDSLQRTATWYEAAIFPHEMRIDMEDPKNGNAIIYSKDSTYRFQNGKLARVTAGTNPFVFLIGGIYSVPFDTAKNYLSQTGFDLTKGYTTYWKNRKTFVIGAFSGDTTSKQVWVDAEQLYLVRFIETTRGTVMDVHMKNQVQLGGGWTETLVEFYFDGKLRQLERYGSMKANPPLDPALYDPKSFGKVHWMQ